MLGLSETVRTVTKLSGQENMKRAVCRNYFDWFYQQLLLQESIVVNITLSLDQFLATRPGE